MTKRKKKTAEDKAYAEWNRQNYEDIYGDSNGVSDDQIEAEMRRRWETDDVPGWRG